MTTTAEHHSHLARLDEDWASALAVVAHPDDLEYGAASVIARWAEQGKRLAYLLVTRGEAGIDGMSPSQAATLREAEQRAAASMLGVDWVDFLDHPDGQVEYGLRLRRDVAASIRRFRPDVVVSLNYRVEGGRGSVNMADHRAVGLAVLDAVRDAANRWVFTDLVDAGLEPWNGVRMMCFAASPFPTHGVEVTGYVEAGIASLQCHREYLAGLGSDLDPAAYLRDQAARTGPLLGVPAAVAFEVVFV